MNVQPTVETETAWQRWIDIEVEHKLIGLFSGILIIFAAAIFVRPENSVTRFWLNELGIQSDYVVWVYIITAMLLPLGWYLWRNMLVIVIATSPLLASMVMLAIQLSQSPTAPLFHGAMAIAVLSLSVMCFYLARELSIYKQIATEAVKPAIED